MCVSVSMCACVCEQADEHDGIEHGAHTQIKKTRTNRERVRACKSERASERETERETERDRETERQTQSQRQGETDTETETEAETETERRVKTCEINAMKAKCLGIPAGSCVMNG
jgi:hypothetical protein